MVHLQTIKNEGHWRPVHCGICYAERTSGWNLKGNTTQMSINVLFFSQTCFSKNFGGFEASVLLVGAIMRTLALAFNYDAQEKKKKNLAT
jgi:hypothetical protein